LKSNYLSESITYELMLCEYRSMSVRDVIVQCLLYTEATRTVLDLIRTGVDTVEAVLVTQSRPVALCVIHNAKCLTYTKSRYDMYTKGLI